MEIARVPGILILGGSVSWGFGCVRFVCGYVPVLGIGAWGCFDFFLDFAIIVWFVDSITAVSRMSYVATASAWQGQAPRFRAECCDDSGL